MGVKVREKIKGSGIWWIFINHNGKRRAKKIGRNKWEANRIAREIERKLAEKDCGLIDKSATFADYAKTWITTSVPATCKRSTLRDYQGLLRNHILPIFGKIPVHKIKRLDIKHFLMRKLNEGYSSSTVTHMKNVLGGVLAQAVDDEVISVNPAHRLGRVIPTPKKIAVDPLTREELSRLLNSFSEHFPRYYPLVLTLARTGLRIGEATALQWGDLDFHGRFIIVRRNISRGRIETPKNGKERRVDMSRQLADCLLRLKTQRKEEALKKGWRGIPEWVFVSEAGTPVDSSHFRSRVFKKALEKAGLRKIRIHDLRHTFASMLIQNGEPLPYIQKQLGHHSIKVTVDVYGHLSPEGNKSAVDNLDDKKFDATRRNLYATRL